jgi:urate oxidase
LTRLLYDRADLAKVSPHVLDPARFALHLAVHLLARYAHLGATFVTVEQLRWARIGAAVGGGEPAPAGHKHAFWRDGAEKRFVEAEVTRKDNGDGAVARVSGGLNDLLGTLMPVVLSRTHARTLLLFFFFSAQVDGVSF